MTTLTFTVPVPGVDYNSIADPELVTALTSIRAWANGNIDAGNVSASGGILHLVTRSVSSNTAAAAGDMIVATAAGLTISLPAPTNDTLIGVFAGAAGTSGASPITITGSAILAPGVLSPFTTILLGAPNTSLLLRATGSQWHVIAGQHDTGWVNMSLGTSITTWETVPQCRRRGDQVLIHGGMANNTGGGLGITQPLALVPAFAIPAANRWLSGVIITGAEAFVGTTSFLLDTTGHIQAPIVANGQIAMLSGDVAYTT